MAAAIALCWCAPGSAFGQAGSSRTIDLPAAPLASAIEAIARTYDVAVGTPGDWPPLQASAIHGRMTVGEALERALRGSGWRARCLGGATWRIEPLPNGAVRRPSLPPEATGQSIYVTGTKRRLDLATLPMAVEVVAFDADSGLRAPPDTAAVAAALPGVTLAGSAPGQNRLFLRGIADSAFNGTAPATVAVVVDNARVSYAGPDPDLRLVDVERVEVLEGPQGTLYGAGTLGGIYHVVTRRPDTERMSLAETGWGGMNGPGTGSPGGGGSIVANLPLIEGSTGLRVVGYGDHAPGWIATQGSSATNATDTSGGRIALATLLGAGWRIDATALTQTIRAADSAYVYQSGALSRPSQRAEPHAHAIDHVALALSGPLGEGQMVLSASRSILRGRQTYDASQGADDLGLADPALFEERTRETLWDAELRANGRKGRLGWLVGASWFQTGFVRDHALTGAAGEQVAVDALHRVAQEAAAFGNLSVAFGWRWQIDVGARLLHDVLRETLVIAPEQTTFVHQLHTGISPSGSIAWHPAQRSTAYLRVSTAFRQGDIARDGSGATTGDGKAAGTSVGGRSEEDSAIAGDRLVTAELGWRRTLPAEGQIEVSGHFTSWHDMEADTLLPNHIIATTNAGVARIIGAVARLHVSPIRNWPLDASGEFENARLVRNELGTALDDTRLPVVPVYTLRMGLRHTFAALGGVAELGGGGGLIGPGRLSFDDSLNRRIGPRLETRLSGEIRWQRLVAGIMIDNVLDARSDTFAYGNPLRLLSMPQFVPMRPRTVLISLGFRP